MPQKNESLAPQTLDKFHEIELEKLSDALMTLHENRIRAITFIATVDVGALSVALSTQRAGVVVFAGIFVCLGIIFDHVQQVGFTRVMYRAIMLEERFSPNDHDTFLSILHLGGFTKKLHEIVNLPDQDERIKKMTALAHKTLLISTFWIPALVAVIEIAAGIILWLNNHWALF